MCRNINGQRKPNWANSPCNRRSRVKEQSQQLFAVTDFKVNKIDVELGTGFGFTPGSDRFIVKAILGYAFPVPGKTADPDSSPMLKMGTPSRMPGY